MRYSEAQRGREDNSAGQRAAEGLRRGDFPSYLPPSFPIIYETTETSALNTMLGRGYPLAFFPEIPIFMIKIKNVSDSVILF